MNEAGKEVDTTFLSLEQANKRGFLHRDYIAHCFRWSHVIKRFMERKRYDIAKILDIGCGRELPFAKTLYSSKMIPSFYTGIDAGPILPDSIEAVTRGKMNGKVQVFPQTLFSNKWALDHYDTQAGVDHVTDIICFEVAEHVEPAMLKDMLAGMLAIIDPKIGRLWISTPCWDYKSCAANHVNEMTYAAFGGMLREAGFRIEDVHGTFASISDYRPYMSAAQVEVFNDLREYYDSNVLATIFAPAFPAQSRNCLWECSIPDPKLGAGLEFGPVHDCQKPWGSSAKWKEMSIFPDKVEVPGPAPTE